MHQQIEYFNNCTLCPHCIYVFCICLRTNSDLCHLHKKKLLVFITDMKSVVFTARYGLGLLMKQSALRLLKVKTHLLNIPLHQNNSEKLEEGGIMSRCQSNHF
jgi:hypothetical protein